MARQPRLVLPGHPQHIIQRGINRAVIFHDKDDYQCYLTKLGHLCEQFNCKLHAYVVMDNHVHLLLTPFATNSLSKLMQSLGRHYAHYFNNKYNRTGTLWDGRYKSCLLDAEQYLITCQQYIELNPVRAGLVATPAAYTWSSYHKNASGLEDVLITEHEIYCKLGSTKTARQAHYQALLEKPANIETLQIIRDNTNNAWVLGDDRFREKIATRLQRQTAPKPRGGDRRSQHYHSLSNSN